MIETFLEAVQEFAQLGPQDIAQLRRAVVPKEYKKDELLLISGDTSRAFHFLIRGAAIRYKITPDLEEQILDLYVPGDWMYDHKSFSLQKPSENNIKAHQACSCVQLTVEALHELIGRSPAFFQLGKPLGFNLWREVMNQGSSPDAHYLYLLKNRPEIIRTFPQKKIASYLNITPETLSRVRKRILQK